MGSPGSCGDHRCSDTLTCGNKPCCHDSKGSYDCGLMADGLRHCPNSGLNLHNRCWYLSWTGHPCDSTCGSNGLQVVWYGAPDAAPVMPQLLGWTPANKELPWAVLECYVPGESRYHTANPY